ncbi:hypothetical protein [Geobacter sp. DSM 9736]|uniref:hypothetical protein n=1 Tax=Geobacter sp. DSM 9736 TaxID=1277350 RepID=UPI000B500518|nr:hypothetical protein [Geobacter sp. DSM 9736]SNB45120.1 hypothetical protein SAMN06269301_0516 [Geobacter sp. DSM 9736]
MKIDQNRLNILTAHPTQLPAAHDLRRDGRIFFVGGELSVNETLETMFDSFCTESTDLFYLSFGPKETCQRGMEMARQIKKNFSVRLMGRFDFPAPASFTEHAYAAGVDILDIPLWVFDPAVATQRGFDTAATIESLRDACSVFPRWSVASTLLFGPEPADSTMKGIDTLLKEGIVPLPAIAWSESGAASEGIEAALKHLACGWKSHDVTIKPLIPLIRYTTPLIPLEQPGLFRGLIDKLQDRRHLAASDLRRHLRVQAAENSLDSAGL